MPNFSDGERCDCPSGHQAGLGLHRDGEPGCMNGPEEFIGRKTKTVLVDEPRPGGGSRRTMPGKQDKPLFLRLYEAAKELVDFIDEPSMGYDSENRRKYDRLRGELRSILTEVEKLKSTPVEDLIAASSLGDEEAVAARESVSQEVVDNILRRADELEAEQREAQQVPGAVYIGYVGPGVHAITFNSAEERNRWAKIIHNATGKPAGEVVVKEEDLDNLVRKAQELGQYVIESLPKAFRLGVEHGKVLSTELGKPLFSRRQFEDALLELLALVPPERMRLIQPASKTAIQWAQESAEKRRT